MSTAHHTSQCLDTEIDGMRLTLRKIAKKIFFPKFAIGSFSEKKTNFGNLKKLKGMVFDIQIAIFWRVRYEAKIGNTSKIILQGG